MNNNLILLGSAERVETLYHTLGEGAVSPTAGLCLREGAAAQDGDLVCSFSGTVYSYADESLPRESPEAYLLAARRKYGERFLEMLEGKFVLALLDLREKTLFFARDHFGGFPLYYCCGEDFAAVSGKLSPLANCGLVKKELSRAGLCDLFSLRFIPAPDTIFEGVRALLPGHCVFARLDGGRVTVEERCWWDVDCRNQRPLRWRQRWRFGIFVSSSVIFQLLRLVWADF